MTSPAGQFGQLHVGQRLRVIDRVHVHDRLHFHDDQVFDDQIDSVLRVEMEALVDKRYGPLTYVAKLARVKFIQQTRRICGFEETGAKAPMNFDAAPRIW